MGGTSIPVLFQELVAFVFAIGGVVHAIAPRALREVYARWEYPRSFLWVVASFELLSAFLLMVPQTRIWGVVLAAVILFVAVITLLKNRQYLYAVPSIALLAALPQVLLTTSI